MRWRVVIDLAVIGIGLIVWGVIEWRLGRGASATPERIALKQLIARGPEGNPNIILTDFELGDDFVTETNNGRWTSVYVPAFPAGEPKPRTGPGQPPTAVKAVIDSTHVHSEAEIGPSRRGPPRPRRRLPGDVAGHRPFLAPHRPALAATAR